MLYNTSKDINNFIFETAVYRFAPNIIEFLVEFGLDVNYVCKDKGNLVDILYNIDNEID
jgi:hypothetical protein